MQTDKIKTFQGFSSFDLITTVMALLAVGVITGPILYKNVESRNVVAAQQTIKLISENLTQEILTNGKSSSDEKARNMASAEGLKQFAWEGVVEKDPWGQSYSYRMLRNAYGLPTHLVVWSKGPNGEQDTPDNELRVVGGNVAFRGDDLGYVRPLGE